MKKALIVCNRKSGHQKGTKWINKLREGISDLYEVSVYVSEYAKSITDYIQKHGEGFDAIISMGGDGTVNEVITAVMQLEKRPKLAFLPFGTCNDVCHTYGYKSVKSVIRKIRLDGEKQIDAFKVNEGYYIYAFAAGSFSEVTYQTDRTKKFLGKLFYYFRGIAKLFKKCDVPYEYKDVKGHGYLFIATNSIHLGGFYIKNKYLNDGLVHLDIVEYKRNRSSVIHFGFKELFGIRSRCIKSYAEPEVKISLGSPLPLNTDGEFLSESSEIHIQAEPKAITIF